MDFLLIEILRQRFRPLYDVIRREPELFLDETLKSQDLTQMYARVVGTSAEEKQQKEQRRQQSYVEFDHLAKDVQKIVEELFPHNPDSKQSCKLRRICHPQFFDRYFTLAFLHGVSPEAQVESLIDSINNTRGNERLKLLADFLLQSDLEAALRNFEFFRLFYEDFKLEESNSLILQLASTTTRLKFQTPAETERVRRLGEDLVCKLIGRLPNDDVATKAVVQVMQHSDPAFVGILVRRAQWSQQGYDDAAFGNRKVDLHRFQNIVDTILKKQLDETTGGFFSLDETSQNSLVQFYSRKAELRQRILSEMHARPKNAILWLQNVYKPITANRLRFQVPEFEVAKTYPLFNEAREILENSRSNLNLDETEEVWLNSFFTWYKNQLRDTNASDENPEQM